jgi:hypothetical protein
MKKILVLLAAMALGGAFTMVPREAAAQTAQTQVVSGALLDFEGAVSWASVHLGTHLRERLVLMVNSRDAAPFPGPSPASGEGWRTPGGEMVHATWRTDGVRRDRVAPQAFRDDWTIPETAARHPSPEAGEGPGKGATSREFTMRTSVFQRCVPR